MLYGMFMLEFYANHFYSCPVKNSFWQNMRAAVD